MTFMSIRSFLITFFTITLFAVGVSCQHHVPRGDANQLLKYMMKETHGLWDGPVDSAEDVYADRAFSLEIEGKQVFFFEFNEKGKHSRKKLETARDTGVFYLLGFKYNAEVNGPFIMIGHDANPKCDEIVKAFRNF